MGNFAPPGAEPHLPFVGEQGFQTRPVAGGALALPDILAAGAGDSFGRKFFGHGIFANRTVFLPHDNTWFSFKSGSLGREIGADYWRRPGQISGLTLR
jgi:hypothetical protein